MNREELVASRSCGSGMWATIKKLVRALHHIMAMMNQADRCVRPRQNLNGSNCHEFGQGPYVDSTVISPSRSNDQPTLKHKP